MKFSSRLFLFFLILSPFSFLSINAKSKENQPEKPKFNCMPHMIIKSLGHGLATIKDLTTDEKAKKIIKKNGNEKRTQWVPNQADKSVRWECHEDTLCAWSEDGNKVIVSDSVTAYVWDVATGKQIGKSFPFSFTPLLYDHYFYSWDPTGQRVIAFGFDKTIQMFDIVSGKEIGKKIKCKKLLDDGVSISWCPDGTKAIIIQIQDNVVITFWDASTGKQVDIDKSIEEENFKTIQWSSDSKKILIGSQIWDSESGKQIGKEIDCKDGILNPEGTMIASCPSIVEDIQIWDVETGKIIKDLVGSKDRFVYGPDVRWSPDGKKIITFVYSGCSGFAKIWDVDSGQQVGNDLVYDESLKSFAWSHDSKKLVINSYDSLQIYDTATGNEIGNPFTFDERVTSVAWSPDNTKLLINTKDNVAKIVSVTTGNQIGDDFRHDGFDDDDDDEDWDNGLAVMMLMGREDLFKF